MAGFGLPESSPAVIGGSDGVARCAWATETGRDLTVYHDSHWGTPTHDRAVLLRELVLTYFENGLSWALIHAKRDAFDASFASFDPMVVASFSPAKVESLLGDRSIVRSRSKIEATVRNAQVVVTDDRFVDRIWDHASTTHYRFRTRADGRMNSPESQSLAKEMRSRGYRFVGPVVAHSFMQTVGVEIGHFDGCFRAPRTDPGGD